MVKTKKTSPQLPLVLFGYILFILLIISVVISTTIPFGKMLFDPRVLHQNVAIITVALTIGALLPAYVAYKIGGTSVKSKSKIRHHFNGVLFGLLAFWVTNIFAIIVFIPTDYLGLSDNARIILMNVLPSIAIAIITTIIAITHVRSRKAKHEIIDYKPYSLILVGLIITVPIWSIIKNVVTQNVSIYSFLDLSIILAVGIVSYITLRKNTLSAMSKVTWSAVSVSAANVAVFVVYQLVLGVSYYVNAMQSAETQMILSLVGWTLGIVVWIIFWHAQVKVLSKK